MNIHRITYNPKLNSASLYFIGCNFRCRGCFWKELYGKTDFKKIRFLNLDETVDVLKKVSPSRVHIISGDPVLSPEFRALPKRLYDEFKCEVRLMTNGFILPDIEGLSHVAFSIKAYDEDLHKRYTGRSNEMCLKNFEKLYANNVDIAASTVLIPDFVWFDEIEKIAGFVASVGKDIPLRIINYAPVADLPLRVPDIKEIDYAVSLASKHLNNVSRSPLSARVDYTGIIDLFTNELQKC